MTVTVAIDSFKESLSSVMAGNAVKDAILKCDPLTTVFVRPLADGGEGTCDTLCEGLGGELVKLKVAGPLGDEVEAQYAVLNDKNTAVMEMASAAGIMLVPSDKRNPLNTTTFGVGEMIADAVTRGCRRFIIGIGGSATNDGGTGMLSALGFKFLDDFGQEIPLGAKGLESLRTIDCGGVMPELAECEFNVACDVDNPLLGPSGCSAVFGPQKGATPEMISDMDLWLERFAKISSTVSSKADALFPGVGAAGGLGFAFRCFLNAELRSGVDLVLKETALEEYIKISDIVVTGEGRLDSQTVMGKAPVGVAKLAKKYNKKVIAFSGCVTDDAEALNQHGIDAFFPILRNVVSLDEALNTDNAYKNLKSTAYQVFRLLFDVKG
ncbi:MAG: glycerate kinase [Clostridia bacterium]|nr:glycerate kinase [Clostridia bacterium]